MSPTKKKKQKVLPSKAVCGSRASRNVSLDANEKNGVRPMALVNKKTLAEMWRKDPRQITRWVEDGMPHTKETTGQREVLFDVCDATEWRISHQMDKKFGELERHKLSQAKSQAELLEIEVRKKKEETIVVQQLEDYLFPIFHNFRSKILGLPSALAHVIAPMKEVTEIENTLRERLFQALEELAIYDRSKLITGRDITQRRKVGITPANTESK